MKKYTITVPIVNSTVTKSTRAEYLALIKKAGIDRVFLSVSNFGCSNEEMSNTVKSLRENLEYFEKNGLVTGVWIGVSIGHGVPITGDERPKECARYTPLVNLNGEVISDTRCPLDTDFQRDFGEYVAKIARTGTKFILLDDDFRLSQHGSELCCACDRHMDAIRELVGEPITREELNSLAFSGKENKYRDAWLKVEGESLYALAGAVRDAVDNVDSKITVGLCSPHCLWDIDGCDPIKLAEILAGDNKPFIRLHSAPYSATISGKPLPLVFELARMFLSFAEGKGCELIAEGDVYPRPRYFTPSSHLELYDVVIRAEGAFDGILKYIFDYVSDPCYETGYIDRHCYMLPMLTDVGKLFLNKHRVGVSTPVRPHTIAKSDLSYGAVSQLSPYPWAGIFSALNGVPSIYGEGGTCSMIFGEEGRFHSLENIEKGAVLDAVSALRLKKRGVDVGIESFRGFEDGSVSELYSEETNTRAAIWKGGCRILRADISPNAEVAESAVFLGDALPFAYRYENASGQRFLVYMFDSSATPLSANVMRGYLTQSILIEGIEWIAREALPAKCVKNPDLYVMCAKSDDDKKLTVALLNCYPDSILEPVIKLDREYKSIKSVSCDADLDGDTVRLRRPVGAFEIAAFEVTI